MTNGSLLLIPVLTKIYCHVDSLQRCYFGHAEATFCINQGLFPEVFDTTWSAPSLENLIENTELALLIPDS